MPAWDADAIVRELGLVPLPAEGGHYRQTWVSGDTVSAAGLPGRYGRDKPLGTAIYFLVTDRPDGFSALHRLPTDEVYHFYLGDPVELWMLHADGRHERTVLGTRLEAHQRPQIVVPRGAWQGSRLVPGGKLALLGTTMAPGYDPMDFELGERNTLLASHPEAAEAIRALTRNSFVSPASPRETKRP